MDRRYVVLPAFGVKASDEAQRNALGRFPQALSTGPKLAHRVEGLDDELQVVDTVAEDGPKLVEMDDAAATQLNASGGPLRAFPEVIYARPDPRLTRPSAPAAPAATSMVVEIRDAASHAPLSDADVYAFTNYLAGWGASGRTDGAGRVTLPLSGSIVERLYVYTTHTHWGAYRTNVTIQPTLTLDVDAVDLGVPDGVRTMYPTTGFDPSAGVTVGVLDTGVGPHGDLNVIGGRNTVTGEPGHDYADGDEHGTHVAGIIGADGVPPSGLRGLAPGVAIQAYRVFGAGVSGASNYAILKAMILAAADGCDVLNLSLGGGPHDPIVEESLVDARDSGLLVVVAAGNGGRRPVEYPAAYAGATAASAMGIEGTFPAGSLFEGDIERPPHSSIDAVEFLASFSNVGPQVAVTGIGVGVISTLPGGVYGPMSGTSMAAPMVAGALASMLSLPAQAALRASARDRARSDALEMLLQTNCRRRFGLTEDGYGLPDPGAV